MFDWLGVLALGAVVLMSDAITGFIGGMKCDESCTHNTGVGNPTDAPWKDVADAWQWDAISWLAVVSALALFIGLATFAIRPGDPVTRVALITAVICATAPWALLLFSGFA